MAAVAHRNCWLKKQNTKTKSITTLAFYCQKCDAFLLRRERDREIKDAKQQENTFLPMSEQVLQSFPSIQNFQNRICPLKGLFHGHLMAVSGCIIILRGRVQSGRLSQ